MTLIATLIAEDVLLFLLDGSGAYVSNDARKPALAGAVLAELALVGAVEIETEKGLWKRTRVVVEDPGTVDDPLLVRALDDIATKKRSPQDLVNHLGKTVPDELCARLVDAGLLRREESKVLGLFSRTRWPATGSAYEATLRATVQGILVRGEEPEARTATVIAILAAADVLAKVVDRGSMSKKDLKQRAEQIAEGGWASEAVRKAIKAAQAATVAAITAATTGAAVAGS